MDKTAEITTATVEEKPLGQTATLSSPCASQARLVLGGPGEIPGTPGEDLDFYTLTKTSVKTLPRDRGPT